MFKNFRKLPWRRCVMAHTHYFFCSSAPFLVTISPSIPQHLLIPVGAVPWHPQQHLWQLQTLPAKKLQDLVADGDSGSYLNINSHWFYQNTWTAFISWLLIQLLQLLSSSRAGSIVQICQLGASPWHDTLILGTISLQRAGSHSWQFHPCSQSQHTLLRQRKEWPSVQGLET